mmetsp:Transcript_2100/g.6179  ORF Transcript_2100/g.6179 Transcript_2100/m.6179 type:complete len:212 (+) Transcript_2100:197-832(+)
MVPPRCSCPAARTICAIAERHPGRTTRPRPRRQPKRRCRVRAEGSRGASAPAPGRSSAAPACRPRRPRRSQGARTEAATRRRGAPPSRWPCFAERSEPRSPCARCRSRSPGRRCAAAGCRSSAHPSQGAVSPPSCLARRHAAKQLPPAVAERKPLPATRAATHASRARWSSAGPPGSFGQSSRAPATPRRFGSQRSSSSRRSCSEDPACGP